MQQAMGKSIFSGAFWPVLLGPLTAASPDLLGLDAEHVGDADTELLRLDDRLDEVVQLVHLVAPRHVVERLDARAAQADLVEHLVELGSQSVAVLVADPAEGGVKAEPGLTLMVSRSSDEGSASRMPFCRAASGGRGSRPAAGSR